jgi:SpoVK/Ycf46/Vps4 family AAA+-type ATPase
MLNKRRIYNRTHIDIHNYNKFLCQLDKTNINKFNIIDENMKMDTILTNLNHNFDNLNSNNFFTGQKEEIDNSYCKTKSKSKSKTKININVEINNINDLLQLINDYPLTNDNEYNINMNILHKIKQPLIKLNNMIGLTHIKENIIDQILFFIQNLHCFTNNNDYMHTVIYGPPGTGKTEIAKIIGEIFSKMGILTKGTFKKVTRSDLVAGYLGQTALKTREIIKECLGGVLFIDEAYSLGNSDKIDSFSKECIDTLCEALSDHKEHLMVIIAGYENELQECFFNVNQGLNSRFTWRFKIDDYNAEELYRIFIKIVTDNKWTIDTNINLKWFEKNKNSFKYFGRDIEILWAKVKIAHSKRVFCKDETEKKIITMNDLEKGFDIYLKNINNYDKYNNYKKILHTMYM